MWADNGKQLIKPGVTLTGNEFHTNNITDCGFVYNAAPKSSKDCLLYIHLYNQLCCVGTV